MTGRSNHIIQVAELDFYGWIRSRFRLLETLHFRPIIALPKLSSLIDHGLHNLDPKP